MSNIIENTRDLELSQEKIREKIMQMNQNLLEKTSNIKKMMEEKLLQDQSSNNLVHAQMSPTGKNVKFEFNREVLKSSSLKQLELSCAEVMEKLLTQTRELAEEQAKELSEVFLNKLKHEQHELAE